MRCRKRCVPATSSRAKVIGTSEDLLTALDASAREIDETLPEALARLDERISTSRKFVAGAKPELLALVTAAESTHDAIEAIADVVCSSATRSPRPRHPARDARHRRRAGRLAGRDRRRHDRDHASFRRELPHRSSSRRW